MEKTEIAMTTIKLMEEAAKLKIEKEDKITKAQKMLRNSKDLALLAIINKLLEAKNK